MNNIITNNQSLCTIAVAALRNVIDPEIGLNIVDLGLVYQVDFDEEEKNIFVSMTLTTQFCPMGESIQSNAVRTVQQVFPQYNVQVNLVFNPPWNASMISEKGKDFLNQ